MKEKKSVLFWLSLSQTILIYAFIIASVSVGFSIVDYYLSDFANRVGSGDGTRFAMAVLVVSTPLIIILGRLKGNIYRKFSEYSESLIKKWTAYVSLFLGGAVLIGDVVAVLYGFFTGELSTSFYLKALILAAFIAYFFWSVLHDLRKSDYSNKKKSTVDAIVIAVLAILLIVSGFVAYGSPKKQRDIKFDNQIEEDLRQIENVISEYIRLNDTALPSSVEDIKRFASELGYSNVDFEDPDGNRYEYNILSEDSFEICATFRTASDSNSGYRAYPYSYSVHNEGEKCFEKSVSTIENEVNRPIIKPRPNLID